MSIKPLLKRAIVGTAALSLLVGTPACQNSLRNVSGRLVGKRAVALTGRKISLMAIKRVEQNFGGGIVSRMVEQSEVRSESDMPTLTDDNGRFAMKIHKDRIEAQREYAIRLAVTETGEAGRSLCRNGALLTFRFGDLGRVELGDIDVDVECEGM